MAPVARAGLVLALLFLAGGACAEGETELVYEVPADHLSAVVDTVCGRLEACGLKDVAVKAGAQGRFVVRMKAGNQGLLQQVKDLVGRQGRLEFRITVEKTADEFEACFEQFRAAVKKGAKEEEACTLLPAQLPPAVRARHPLGVRWYRLLQEADEAFGRRAAKDEHGHLWMLMDLDAQQLSGDALEKIYWARDQGGLGQSWAVYFGVRKEWQARMAALTDFKEDKHMAILLDDRVHSAPVVRSTLSDSGQITGSFTEAEARSLAAILLSGALPCRPTLVAER